MEVEAGEQRRLAAVLALELLDTPPEAEYTELVELAAEMCGTPISAISIVDDRRQWFKAAVGLPMTEVDRELTVCTHTLRESGLMVIEDLQEDERFWDNPMVQGHSGMRFYAGFRLLADQEAIGTLCVVDTVPRTLSDSQRRGLGILARQVQSRLELRGKQRRLARLSLETDRLSRTLEAKNTLFRAFMDHGPFVSYIKDGEGRLIFYNNKMRESFGVDGDAWLGKLDHDLWPAEMADKFREHDTAIIRGGVPVVLEEQSPGPAGTTRTWRSYKFPILDEQDAVMLAGISVDVTAEIERQQQLELALRESQELSASLTQSHAMLRTLLENNPNQCYLKSEDGKYLFYNRKFAEHFGISTTKWLGKTDHELVPKALAEKLRAHDVLAMASDGVVETMGDLSGMEGTRSTFKVLKFRCLDQNGSKMLAGMAIDITEELEREKAMKRAFVELEELASVDALTGLPNRRSFDRRLAVEFTRAEAAGRPLALLILDIDNFKQRNDRFGHAAGDEALRMVGASLLRCCRRKGDMAARVGGEEFAFLLPETEAAEAEQMAQRVLQEVRKISANATPLTVSVGVATMNATTRSGSRLYTRADDAMYAAKRTGKDRAVMHSAHLNALLRDVAHDLSQKEQAQRDSGEHGGPVAVRRAS